MLSSPKKNGLESVSQPLGAVFCREVWAIIMVVQKLSIVTMEGVACCGVDKNVLLWVGVVLLENAKGHFAKYQFHLISVIPEVNGHFVLHVGAEQ